MTETIGIQKLKALMLNHGYKQISESIGVGPSILYQYCNGERDPQGMKMKTATKIKKIYGIDFEDWGKTAKPEESSILDK